MAIGTWRGIRGWDNTKFWRVDLIIGMWRFAVLSQLAFTLLSAKYILKRIVKMIME